MKIPINLSNQKPDIHNLKEDGVDHINIFNSEAKTDLGKMLRMSSKATFVHPILGKFSTVDGFWYYVKTKGASDEFRLPRTSYYYRTLVKDYKKYRFKNFQKYIVDAMYEKIIQNPEIKEAVIASDLPFANYWLSGSVRVAPSGVDFIVNGLELIRKVLKEGFELERPDYSEDFSDLIVTEED